MRALPLILIPAVLLGCNNVDPYVPADGPPAVAGGTLLITHDQLAVASDPDRASIQIADLTAQGFLHRIQLEPGDEPGRSIEDTDGRVHVVLRRAGQLLTIDPRAGEIIERRDLCAAPRGIALDGSDLIVACAEGDLVRLPAAGGAITHRTHLLPDLRDVVVRPNGILFVSRLRSAQVLVVQNDAVIDVRQPPNADGGFGIPTGDPRDPSARFHVPTVAYRMIPHPAGALMVHQQSLGSVVDTTASTFTGASPYGGGGNCDGAIVRSAITLFRDDGTTVSGALEQTSLAVDIAYDTGTRMIYVAAAAEPSSTPTSFTVPVSGLRVIGEDALVAGGNCLFSGSTAADIAPGRGGFVPTGPGAVTDRSNDAAAVGVAVALGGQVVTQYRDPGVLTIGASQGQRIALEGGSATTLGSALFHEAAGSGMTCAGCHPEGGDDGHVWNLDTGARRTQTLTGGILATAPFHHSGDIPNVSAVMAGTFVQRMGGTPPRSDEIDSLGHWMDRLPQLPPPRLVGTAIDRGRAIFERPDGCTSCHSGEQRTNNRTMDVETGHFQVPALYEIAYHAPYLHDGSAATLGDLLEHHQGAATLSIQERSDLSTYLNSL